MIRMVTRLSHSRAGIEISKRKVQNSIHLPKNPHQFQLIPMHARNRYQHLVAIQSDIEKVLEIGILINLLMVQILSWELLLLELHTII